MRGGTFQLELPLDLRDRVHWMMEQTGVLDPSELAARALRLYDRALAAGIEGDSIYIKFRSGGEARLA